MPAPRDCTGCPLHKHRKQVVNGFGPAAPKIVVVGEAPGEQEDIQGRGFVGESGQVLRRYMQQVGINPESCHWLNVCRCRPPGNRTPKAAEVKACWPYLLADLKELRPNLILSLGAPALAALWSAVSINQMRGHLLQQPDTGLKILPTFHPAYIGREWGKEPEILADLAKAMIESAHPDLNVAPTERVELRTVEDVLWFRDWIAEIAPTLEALVLDVETTGLSYLTDEILCLGMVPKRGSDFFGSGYVVPILGQHVTPYWRDDDLQTVIDAIQDVFNAAPAAAGQNLKFDQKFLERYPGDSGLSPEVCTAFGFTLPRCGLQTAAFDTMLAFHLLHEERPHSLSYQQSLYTTMPYYEEGIIGQTSSKRDMASAEPEMLYQYQAADVDCTAQVMDAHRRALAAEPKLQWLFDNIAMPLHDLTRRIENRGVLIDRVRFDELCLTYGHRIAEAELDVFRHHPPFNYNSTPQLRKVLFTDLKLPRPGLKTKGAKDCDECREGFCEKHDATGIEALNAIKEKKSHPILADLITLKQLTKLKGTYLDGTGGKSRGLLDDIMLDGRIHTTYRIEGTETGRLSSAPNLQNIPKTEEFRRLFIAPPGCQFLKVDWSQLELWCMAYVSGDKTMLDLLLSGVDIHTYVARKLWPHVDPHSTDEEWAAAHDDLRKKAKGFNFGVDYGLTAHTISKRFGMSIAEAEALLAMYLREIFPGLARYFACRQKDIIVNGGVANELGRQRRFYGVRTFKGSRTFRRQIGHIQRQAYNFPIQSIGSDIHSLASIAVDLDPWLGEFVGDHVRACIVLSVHDEIGLEIAGGDPDGEIVDVARHIKETMEEIPRQLLGWRLPVEAAWGPSWGEAVRKLDKKGQVNFVAV